MQAIEGYFVKAQDSRVAQPILYSIPIINVVSRFIQNKHSLDLLIEMKDQTDVAKVFLKKEIEFRNDLAFASRIQLIVFIASLILGVTVPSALAVSLCFGLGSFALMLSNFLMVNAICRFPHERLSL